MDQYQFKRTENSCSLLGPLEATNALSSPFDQPQSNPCKKHRLTGSIQRDSHDLLDLLCPPLSHSSRTLSLCPSARSHQHSRLDHYVIVPSRTLQNQLKLRETFKVFAFKVFAPLRQCSPELQEHHPLPKSWKAPFSARTQYTYTSSLTTLKDGPARGYTEVPQVERAVAMHLCPQNTATLRGRLRIPSTACKFSWALVVKACTASKQAASVLHAMAILQVYQAKVLKDLHKGVPDPELLQEMDAMDYALRATKVTAQALGRAKSTMAVQERHLWLNLAEMRGQLHL
ncbi:DNA damage-inducible protein 1 [Labeo rohita]|uniref:DNA damage-inducible protein 1 n=1 Tax=Labeo rohita TaxID=84645 RepID=A0ABQ8MDR6_LABRO|nr:DNA damage-inducible protein 1 [Labeo rohita]